MIAGHFALAAAVKSRHPALPVWALMLATQWLDVVFVPLVLTGIESLTPIGHGGYGEVIIHADYTHAFAGALLLAALFGAVAAWRWGRTAGAVLGGVVFSHWVLDLLVHRGDMPILPANALALPRLGFGLWERPSVAIGLELAMVLVGMGLYWREAVRRSRGAGVSLGRAHAAGAAAMMSGLLTLALNAAGQ